MKSVSIEVPASSANLGPGFDCLGLALDITDTIEAHFDSDTTDVRLQVPEGHNLHPVTNLICRGYSAWFQDTGAPVRPVRFTLESRIPFRRGFGSSAAMLVAGLAAGSHATGEREPIPRMIRLAAALEGHGDNTTAAILGGVVVAFCDDGEAHALPVVSHLGLGVALYVPDDTLSTSQARAALPKKVSHRDAVFNVGRAAYLVSALNWGRWECIGAAMEDRLHQPYRSALIPALDSVMAAARAAGAFGSALSGAGPSVIALGPKDRIEGIADAMKDAASRREWPGHSLVTGVRHLGVQVKVLD